jgi:hypothetical protein
LKRISSAARFWQGLSEAIALGECMRCMLSRQRLSTFPRIWSYLRYAYEVSRDRPKALAVVKELNHKSLHGYAPPFNLAAVYVEIGDCERWIIWKSLRSHLTRLIFKMDRMFEALRSDARLSRYFKTCTRINDRCPSRKRSANATKEEPER